MKKIATLSLILAASLTLAACSKSEAPPPPLEVAIAEPEIPPARQCALLVSGGKTAADRAALAAKLPECAGVTDLEGAIAASKAEAPPGDAEEVANATPEGAPAK